MSAIHAEPQTRRCAIYVRRSSHQGLEEKFNSLAAQEQMCSAYIESQAYRGWLRTPKVYVDAGKSGASLERDGIRDLISDIETGLVDIVVVYKLDRLSRSLADFVRLLTVFERSGATFVCITQNFDTGDSLGRLIMNILLTFAQFERELTSERLRDKRRLMAAAGLWLGSHPPYGYDFVDKRLVLNPDEASVVRYIFRRYLELGSMMGVWRDAVARGVLSKRRVSRAGHVVEGYPIQSGTIRQILRNPTYMGDVVRRGTRYPGLHQPIIDRQTWDAAERLRFQTACVRNPDAPTDLLPPVIYDSEGRRMTMSRRYRDGKWYRSYGSNQSVWGKAHRMPTRHATASALERVIIAGLRATLSDRERARTVLLASPISAFELDELTKRCEAASQRLCGLEAPQLRAVLASIISLIELSRDTVRVAIKLAQLKEYVAWDGICPFALDGGTGSRSPTYVLEIPATGLRLRKRSFRLPIEPKVQAPNSKPDAALVRLIKAVRRAQFLLDEERSIPIAKIAEKMGRKPGEFMKLVQLNYLAPDIIAAILNGDQPNALTRKALVSADLPMDWPTQRRLFGFPDA